MRSGKFDECINLIESSGARLVRSRPICWFCSAMRISPKASLDEAEAAYLVALEGRLDNAGALLGLAQISRAKGELRETSIFLDARGDAQR